MRLHRLEIEEQTWWPAVMRDAITDYLQFVVERFKPYRVTRVTLTDHYPNTDVAHATNSHESGVLHYEDRAVNAMDVPASLQGFRTMFASFHHFAPDDARRIIADAVEKRCGLAVFELTERSLPAILGMLLAPIVALILAPQIRPIRATGVALTYLLPIVPLAVLFDGIVSCSASPGCITPGILEPAIVAIKQ